MNVCLDATSLEYTYEKNQLEYDSYRAMNLGLGENVSLNIGDDNVFDNDQFSFGLDQVSISILLS